MSSVWAGELEVCLEITNVVSELFYEFLLLNISPSLVLWW